MKVPLAITLTIDRVTGMETGSFDHMEETRPSLQAILFRKGPDHGFSLTRQPTVIGYTGESYSAQLIAQ